jgi:hypothetical protein
MDDFRRRYDVPRRDYGMPAAAPTQPPQHPTPARPTAPPQHQPAHHPTHQSQPSHHQAHPAAPPARIDDFQATAPQHHPHQAVHHQPLPAKDSVFTRLAESKTAKIVGVAIILLVAGFIILSSRPAKPKSVLPADLAKKASFSVFYPSSLPAGFSYDPTISTFANGQAYYLLNKGTEHIVVREQAWSSSTLDTSSLTNPVDLPISSGKAAIGTNTGQTAAVVLTGSTLINITSNGSVAKDEMTAVINSLKNISLSH